VPHDGQRAKLRRLRQSWAAFEKACAKDEYLRGTRERLLDVMAEKYPGSDQAAEVACQMVVATARGQADAAGGEFPTLLNVLLNQIESNLDGGPARAQVPPAWLLKPRPAA